MRLTLNKLKAHGACCEGLKVYTLYLKKGGSSDLGDILIKLINTPYPDNYVPGGYQDVTYKAAAYWLWYHYITPINPLLNYDFFNPTLVGTDATQMLMALPKRKRNEAIRWLAGLVK